MNRMNRLLLIFFALFSLTAATVLQAGEAAGEIWIDVRTPTEYQQGHKSGAINIPHTAIEQRIQEITTDKAAEIHLYCRSGKRAGMAKAALERMGYTHVINEGGLSDVQ